MLRDDLQSSRYRIVGNVAHQVHIPGAGYSNSAILHTYEGYTDLIVCLQAVQIGLRRASFYGPAVMMSMEPVQETALGHPVLNWRPAIFGNNIICNQDIVITTIITHTNRICTSYERTNRFGRTCHNNRVFRRSSAFVVLQLSFVSRFYRAPETLTYIVLIGFYRIVGRTFRPVVPKSGLRIVTQNLIVVSRSIGNRLGSGLLIQGFTVIGDCSSGLLGILGLNVLINIRNAD